MSEDIQQIVLWLIPAAPLLAAIVTALLGPKLLRYKSHLPCWSALAVSFVCSLILLLKILPSVESGRSARRKPRSGYRSNQQRTHR